MPSAAAQIRQELREKLGISKQALTNRVRKVKDSVPMAPEQALYVLAFEHGIQLDKHLDADELSTVADQVQRYQRATKSATSEIVDAGTKTRNSRPRKQATPREVIIRATGTDFSDLPKLMFGLVGPAQRAAEEAYHLLHIFENSMREVIRRVLKGQYGSDWWDHVPKKIREKAARYQQNEAKEAWHLPRGSEPIQYVDLPDLAIIIEHHKLWPHFSQLFPRPGFVSSLVHDINVSRRVVAHMNELPKAEIKTVQVTFRKWARQLKANEDLIP